MRRGSSRRLIPEPNKVAMVRLLSAGAGGGLNRGDDVLVASAAAEIAVDSVPDLGLARRGVLGQEVDRRHNESRSAEPALQAGLLPERLLEGMEPTVRGQSLDRRDSPAFRLHGEHRAALHRAAVDKDRAGAALARIAPDVRAREVELIA